MSSDLIFLLPNDRNFKMYDLILARWFAAAEPL